MIRLTGVGKTYPDGTAAVHELDLSVAAGELVVLVGPSGCGKSTTLKMINRLIEPTTGTIELDGKDVTHADPVELRRGIGYVIQQVGLFPHQSIETNVMTVPLLYGESKSTARARAHELMEMVGLDAKTYAGALPAPALRRPAAAGRRGARAGRQPAGAADGRALRRGRSRRTRAAAGRVPRAAAGARQDRRVRHPRHRRGGQARRPGRGVRRAAAGSPRSPPRRSCWPAPPTTTSPTSSAPPPACGGSRSPRSTATTSSRSTASTPATSPPRSTWTPRSRRRWRPCCATTARWSASRTARSSSAC